MEKSWYTYKNNKVNGPFSKREIHGMLSRGEIKDNNQAWSKEFGKWKPISQIELLNKGLSVPNEKLSNENTNKIMTPPLGTNDTSETKDPNLYRNKEINTIDIDTELNQVRPWVRYFAKLTDIYFFASLFGFTLALISFEGYMAFYSNQLIAGILILFIYNFFEALMLSAWGTTIGKWLLGTFVKDIHGNNLSYSSALSRSFRVYVQGLGLGVPLVSFITLIMSYYSLTNSVFGKTNWDFLGGHRVVHSKLNPLKVFSLILLWILLGWLMA